MIGKTARTWSDQPAVVEASPIILHASMTGLVVEVRHSSRCLDASGCGNQLPCSNYEHDEPPYYVTIGGLFGSQTLRVESADDVFKILQAISDHSKDVALKLPDYAKIVEVE